MELLRCHSWPGNVRELLHAIEAAVIVCDGSEITPADLNPAIRGNAPVAARESSEPEELPSLRQVEQDHIARVVRATNGHRGNAARILGISERNLYRKLKEYQLLS